MATSSLAVLVVDDSALMRNLISRIVNSAPDLTVAATAMNGAFALQKLERLDVDIILLDLEMPQMDGLEFLKERRKRRMEAPVIILSSLVTRGATITMEAMSLGASDFILKPSGSISHDIHTVGDQILEMVRHYGSQYRRRRSMEPPPDASHARNEETIAPVPAVDPRQTAPDGAPAHSAASRGTSRQPAHSPVSRQAPGRSDLRRIEPEAPPGPTEIIAIGVSTGGPNALRKLFAGLEADLKVPIVVVQHMPEGFTREFAKSLDRICPLSVKEAEDGDALTPGRALIAPGNHHMEVERKQSDGRVRVYVGEPRNGHRPSVDVLFESVASNYGRNALAVLMTGMGRDGALGLGDIRRSGGITIGQDEATSVVYGMPKVAYELGHVQRQVSLPELAAVLCDLAKEKRKA